MKPVLLAVAFLAAAAPALGQDVRFDYATGRTTAPIPDANFAFTGIDPAAATWTLSAVEGWQGVIRVPGPVPSERFHAVTHHYSIPMSSARTAGGTNLTGYGGPAATVMGYRPSVGQVVDLGDGVTGTWVDVRPGSQTRSFVASGGGKAAPVCGVYPK